MHLGQVPITSELSFYKIEIVILYEFFTSNTYLLFYALYLFFEILIF